MCGMYRLYIPARMCDICLLVLNLLTCLGLLRRPIGWTGSCECTPRVRRCARSCGVAQKRRREQISAVCGRAESRPGAAAGNPIHPSASSVCALASATWTRAWALGPALGPRLASLCLATTDLLVEVAASVVAASEASRASPHRPPQPGRGRCCHFAQSCAAADGDSLHNTAWGEVEWLHHSRLPTTPSRLPKIPLAAIGVASV